MLKIWINTLYQSDFERSRGWLFSFQGQLTLSVGFADWTTPFMGFVFAIVSGGALWQGESNLSILRWNKPPIWPAMYEKVLYCKDWVQNQKAPSYFSFLSSIEALCLTPCLTPLSGWQAPPTGNFERTDGGTTDGRMNGIRPLQKFWYGRTNGIKVLTGPLNVWYHFCSDLF